ncbi:unnamed protein product [Gongylonema pulchrum]|uniref:Ovule protein n=1 Tax=Gongylonema pulchrum TaxID=637853 RepID=A0A183D5L0_9BILA|nr:unnamed protein product [Gongylonema pulchrum]
MATYWMIPLAELPSVRFPSLTKAKNELNAATYSQFTRLAYTRCFGSVNSQLLETIIHENHVCTVGRKPKNSLVTWKLENSLSLVYHPSSSRFCKYFLPLLGRFKEL